MSGEETDDVVGKVISFIAPRAIRVRGLWVWMVIDQIGVDNYRWSMEGTHRSFDVHSSDNDGATLCGMDGTLRYSAHDPEGFARYRSTCVIGPRTIDVLKRCVGRDGWPWITFLADEVFVTKEPFKFGEADAARKNAIAIENIPAYLAGEAAFHYWMDQLVFHGDTAGFGFGNIAKFVEELRYEVEAAQGKLDRKRAQEALWKIERWRRHEAELHSDPADLRTPISEIAADVITLSTPATPIERDDLTQKRGDRHLAAVGSFMARPRTPATAS